MFAIYLILAPAMRPPRCDYETRARETVRRATGTLAAGLAVLVLSGCGGPAPEHWHTEKLTSEFTAGDEQHIDSFEQYLELEEQVFAQLDQLIFAENSTGPQHALERYSRGSVADPAQRQPNWNRSFELHSDNPAGGILLLHGMSDSPYSLRVLGESLHQQGFQVLGLRMPGHGTAPSGMISVSWRDMAALTRLGMAHLASRVGDRPIHIIGYSTGAALALDFALQAEQRTAGPEPASLVLISPAIGISPAAALAKWKRRLAAIPGLGSLAWLQIEPEFDPYKYNSFATNAAEQVHNLTSSVASRIAARADPEQQLPPILILKSTVDATVSTDAVVDRLLSKLAPERHTMVLFDINRFAANTSLLIDDPGPFTQRLVADATLPFALTIVANSDSVGQGVSAFHKAPFTTSLSGTEPLGLEWPPGVFSLSHVALPFPPDDPLYGRTRPDDRNELFLGYQAFQGERGVLKIPGDFLLRLRHNPFYDYLERRVLEWIEGRPSAGSRLSTKEQRGQE